MLTKLFVSFLLIATPIKVYSLSGVISNIQGKVSVQTPKELIEDPKNGLEIPVGTVIKTGLKGSVTLKILSSESVIKPLSMVRISEIGQVENENKIDLQLRRGTISARVDKLEGKKNSFQVKTPVSTLSVRGTELEITHGPDFGTETRTITGVVAIEDTKGNTRTVTKNETTSVKENKAPTTATQENNVVASVQIAPPELTETEQASIENSSEKVSEPPAETPLAEVTQVINEAKKAMVNARIQFVE